MTSETIPIWLRYSERAFTFNFVAFAFVMFSCWFPTGFSATFSTFAFLFALPIFFHHFRSVELNRFELAGLVLFGWLLLSVFWSDSDLSDSLAYLSEYRFYFMLPVLTSVLALKEQTQRWTFVAAMLGASVALVTSYGLGFGWWKIEGVQFSLGNRIYHGFIMSSFFLACLLIAREARGMTRVLAGFIALSVAYNVLNIETGRTGYLQVVCVCLAFTVLTFNRIQAVLAFIAALILFGVSYLSFERFSDQVNHTLINAKKVIVSDDYHSSGGYRLEFYKEAIKIGVDHPMTGVGVGDVVSTLRARAEAGEMRVLTDNVHSEFLNMLVAGGVPALSLFAIFLIFVAYSGFTIRQRSCCLGDALIGLGVIIFVSAVFNSTIKDYGEKHALLIMLSILGARLSSQGKLDDGFFGSLIPRSPRKIVT